MNTITCIPILVLHIQDVALAHNSLVLIVLSRHERCQPTFVSRNEAKESCHIRTYCHLTQRVHERETARIPVLTLQSSVTQPTHYGKGSKGRRATIESPIVRDRSW